MYLIQVIILNILSFLNVQCVSEIRPVKVTRYDSGDLIHVNKNTCGIIKGATYKKIKRTPRKYCYCKYATSTFHFMSRTHYGCYSRTELEEDCNLYYSNSIIRSKTIQPAYGDTAYDGYVYGTIKNWKKIFSPTLNVFVWNQKWEKAFKHAEYDRVYKNLKFNGFNYLAGKLVKVTVEGTRGTHCLLLKGAGEITYNSPLPYTPLVPYTVKRTTDGGGGGDGLSTTPVAIKKNRTDNKDGIIIGVVIVLIIILLIIVALIYRYRSKLKDTWLCIQFMKLWNKQTCCLKDNSQTKKDISNPSYLTKQQKPPVEEEEEYTSLDQTQIQNTDYATFNQSNKQQRFESENIYTDTNSLTYSTIPDKTNAPVYMETEPEYTEPSRCK